MTLKKTALWGLIALAVLCGACQPKSGSPETSLTMKSGVLTVGMEVGYPPMEYIDESGNLAGFDVQMAKALAAKMGLEVEFVDTAWDGIFAGVDTSKYDCIMSAVTITDARLTAHNFTKPYIANTQAIVLLKGSALKPKGPEDLGGLGVAYQEETTSDILMTGLADQGLQFTPYEYAKVMNCFDELQLGRVDAIICDSLVAVDYIAPEDSPFEIVWQGSEGEVFGICLKKGNDALTAELDKALDELFADGTMLKISQDVFKVDMVSASR